jgi:two-component system, NarL family, sensor kinase
VTTGSDARRGRAAAALRPRQVVVRLALGLTAVLVLVGVLGAFAAQLLAEREAVNDAANIADVFAATVVQPAITAALADGDPDAVAAFDAVARERILGPNVVRVKIWSPSGTVLYADEPELIGRTFALGDDQREALASPQTRAEVSDLSSSENEFETGGRLLEVYRPVWAPDGRQLLFEMYSPYAPVGERSGELWRGFAGVTVSSLLLLVALTAPIVWRLLSRVRGDERERIALLERTVDASERERGRIAATLHDGPVQELVASAFAAENVATTAQQRDQHALSAQAADLAATLRGNVRALRSLLIDIYPRSLADAGVAQALADLAESVRGRGLHVTVDVADDLGPLHEDAGRLVYRVAQETVRNVAAHSGAPTAAVGLTRSGDAVILEVADAGAGFDAVSVRPGHFGTRIIAELAADAGATLEVATAPGRGTRWRLRVPHAIEGDG